MSAGCQADQDAQLGPLFPLHQILNLLLKGLVINVQHDLAPPFPDTMPQSGGRLSRFRDRKRPGGGKKSAAAAHPFSVSAGGCGCHSPNKRKRTYWAGPATVQALASQGGEIALGDALLFDTTCSNHLAVSPRVRGSDPYPCGSLTYRNDYTILRYHIMPSLPGLSTVPRVIFP